ncbi:hypothetical protein I4U23_028721 [Adineta vaga]|nr:hypothetical protein I4U23_028721 [Adineta vaga]
MAALSEEQLRKEFEKLDKSKDGTITVDELRTYYLPMQDMLGISPQLAELEIQGLLKKLDNDHDEKITFDEFKQLLQKK